MVTVDRVEPCHYTEYMPARNRVKTYVENSFYHAYNRGVEKRDIFVDEYDYRVFMNLIKIYLSPSDEAIDEMKEIFPEKRIRLRKTFNGEIKILALCLMPNHFHLLLRQKSASGMSEFLRAISTSYSMYFNKRHHRVGSLFQGVYKAIFVPNDEYLMHLSRYIHRNPIKLTGFNPVNLDRYPYSSYSTYFNPSSRPWIDTEIISEYFESEDKFSTQLYREFVEMAGDDETTPLEDLAELSMEDE